MAAFGGDVGTGFCGLDVAALGAAPWAVLGAALIWGGASIVTGSRRRFGLQY